MTQIAPVFKREFLGYFRSPVAYVFLIVFSIASVGLSFFIGAFFKAGQASMERYSDFYPWIFVLFIPAAGMRLWSEEKRTGSIELLFTLPLTTLEAVVAKYLAAWAFISASILLSFPLLLTVTYLGAALMAGGYLGVCSLTSALTKTRSLAS